jgi:hypothetical protein
MLLGVTVAAAVVAWAEWRLRRLRPLLGADEAPPSDLQELGQLTGRLLEARRPAVGRVLGELWRRLDVRRHPWRLVALTCAVCAASAFQLGAAPDGFWPAAAAGRGRGALLAGGVCAVVEVAAVVGCFAGSRRLLGLWAPDREATP